MENINQNFAEELKEKGIEIIKSLNENLSEESKKKNIAVFGLGFVGLPLALSFSLRGCNVFGVDVLKDLVDEINSGCTHHTEQFYGVGIQDILRMQLEEGRFYAYTTAEEAMTKCNNFVVTVGIPVVNGEHNFDYLYGAANTIGHSLKRGDLVIIRSTVVPGTTEEKILPILERQSGLKAGEDFCLAFSSERIAEGKAFDEFANMPTLVAGINEESTARAKEILSIVCKAPVVEASDMKVVETAKVFENVQRDVNIAMVQEFARFTENLGIDIYEVVEMANTHKRVNLLTPGPGVGGYCIPNAYHYIQPKADEVGVSMDILRLSRAKNAKLPEFISNKAEELLIANGKTIEDATIGVLGLAMKDYSNDDRISPPIEIVNMLINKGAEVKAYDPIVPTKYEFKVDELKQAIEGIDMLMILAKQTKYEDEDLLSLLQKKTIIMDTRGLIDKEKAVDKGMGYWKI